MKIMFVILTITVLSGCSKNIHQYKESPCACFEYEIFGGEKYDIDNS